MEEEGCGAGPDNKGTLNWFLSSLLQMSLTHRAKKSIIQISDA